MPTTPDKDLNAASMAAIVLAAGQSQRMGAFKSLLPFGSTTVIGSCIEYLTAAGVGTIIVVIGHRADDIREHLKPSNVIFAENPDPHAEMTSSVACGVNHLPSEAKAILIVPADLPAVPSEVVSQLMAQWGTGHRLVKPTWEGRGGHPVLVDISFKDQLLRLDPRLGLKAFFDNHLDQVKRLAVKSKYIARDIDTWDDYAALHQELFGTSPPVFQGFGHGRTESN